MLALTIGGLVKTILLVVLGLFVLIILLMVYDSIVTPKINDEEFLEYLGFDWKTGLQIRDGLNELYCPQRKFFGIISIGWIYVKLNRLEEEGFVESRNKVLTEEELAKRGGLGAKEYRRTGLRRPIPVRSRTQFKPATA
jgi:hypothetical protein